MKRTLIIIALLALLVPGVLLAQQGGLTLEGLAARLDSFESRLAAVERALAVTPAATSAQTGPRFTVARHAVNVRAGPGINYAVIDWVKRGQSFAFDGRNHAGDWIRFRTDKGHGWVYAPLMNVTGMHTVPVVESPARVRRPAPSKPAQVKDAPAPTPQRDAQYYKDLCGVGQRGWVTISLARQCGFSMPVCESSNPGLYDAMHDADGDGCVGE